LLFVHCHHVLALLSAHALLVFYGAAGPSVIRIRIEVLRADDLARVLVKVLEVC
jgi:hypothetical protein